MNGKNNFPCKDAFINTWQLLSPVGKGGNGEVWKARDKDGREVAIKFLFQRHLNSSRYERFVSEVSYHEKLGNRKGILPLIESYLPSAPSRTDRPWLATQYATPLANALDGMNNDFIHTVEAVRTISLTLTQIHSEGAAHRDIKPDNLFYLDGIAVIGDFGLVDYPEKKPLTEKSERLGPMFYIAPEMMINTDQCDPKLADVYSLAKTLWVLATGQHYPLPGELRMDTTQARMSTYVQNSRAEALDYLLEQATRHDPVKRPSMGEFTAELTAWLTPITTISVPDMSKLAARFRPLVDLAKSNVEALSAKNESYFQQATELINFLHEIHISVCNTTGIGNPSIDINNKPGVRTMFSKFFPSSSGKIAPSALLHSSTCHQHVRARTLLRDLFIDFYYGFIFEVDSDEIGYLTLGMVLDYGKNSEQIPFPFTRRNPPKIIRKLTCEFPFGTAQQKLEITKLLNEFRNYLPEALGNFADVMANPETL